MKLLNGCAFNGNYWFFMSAMTEQKFGVSLRWLGNEAFPNDQSPYYVPESARNYYPHEGGPVRTIVDTQALLCEIPGA